MTIPKQDRLAFLRVLAWLSVRDRKIAAAELIFLEAVALELELEHEAVSASLAGAETAVAESLAQAFSSDWVKLLLLHRLLILAICDGDYDARERAGLFKLAKLLNVAHEQVELLEEGIACDLRGEADLQGKAASAKEAIASGWSWQRMLKVGALSVGGTALLAVTGGLAAPAIGGAIGTTFMGLSGAAATSAGLAFLGGGALTAGGLGMSGGAAVVTVSVGLTGGGLVAKAVVGRTGDLNEFGFVPLGGGGTHVVVGVSGFLSQGGDFASDWSALGEAYPHSERFALCWESQVLRNLGVALGAAGLKGPKGRRCTPCACGRA